MAFEEEIAISVTKVLELRSLYVNEMAVFFKVGSSIGARIEVNADHLLGYQFGVTELQDTIIFQVLIRNKLKSLTGPVTKLDHARSADQVGLMSQDLHHLRARSNLNQQFEL
jgi:hypothetical protein